MLQFKLPAAHCFPIPAGEAQGLTPYILQGRAAIFGHEKDYGLQESPRASLPCGKRGDGREEPMSQLHACWEGKVVEEI